MDDKPRLQPGLYGLIDDSLRPELPMLEKALAAAAGGARVLQLRLKRTGDRDALELIRRVVKQVDAQVIVNDRVDLALLGGAAGVHLGDDDLPVKEARAVLGPKGLIGATTRTLEQIQAAARDGADHVGLGPIFSTSTKQVPYALLGLEGLKDICAKSPLPVVAIAGITLQRIGDVRRAGAHAAAVGSGLLDSESISERARALQAAFFGT